MPTQHHSHARIDGRTRRTVLDFEIDDFVLQPVAELGNALCEVSAGLELRVLDTLHAEVGQGVRQ